jgi:hypothetical protein
MNAKKFFEAIDVLAQTGLLESLDSPEVLEIIEVLGFSVLAKAGAFNVCDGECGAEYDDECEGPPCTCIEGCPNKE